MKYENKTLLDAYLMTRCRRLNGMSSRSILRFVCLIVFSPLPVLIQPNLKFLHELLGWEVETKASETSDPYARKAEILQRYSWPSLCRDLVSAVLDLDGGCWG
jgi:dual specificity MAP kinase phosphatase